MNRPQLWWSPTRGLHIGQDSTVVRLTNRDGLVVNTHQVALPEDAEQVGGESAGQSECAVELAGATGAPDDASWPELVDHARRLHLWADQVVASVTQANEAGRIALRGLDEVLKEWTQ